jgi:anti-sigma factor ChrR (cupin superfamily)
MTANRDSSGSVNGDMSLRACMDTADMAWRPSPSGSVSRKRVHLVGEPESGQVTSVVRYEPGSAFPAHDHPEGEEILVLEGTFQDEHGDWPAGTYLLNPEGFRHAPFSQGGCRLFVKLRQFGGPGREHLAIQTTDLAWEPSDIPGIDHMPLYQPPVSEAAGTGRESMRLERWRAGTQVGKREYPEGVEIFVVRGAFADELGHYREGAWLRLPAGASHSPFPSSPSPSSSEEEEGGGCELYVKTGAVSSLRSI